MSVMFFCCETEIRSHGTGFYQFSKDSNLREEQMEMLNKLREQVTQCTLFHATPGVHDFCFLCFEPCASVVLSGLVYLQ